jgi:hypothetical protein
LDAFHFGHIRERFLFKRGGELFDLSH